MVFSLNPRRQPSGRLSSSGKANQRMPISQTRSLKVRTIYPERRIETNHNDQVTERKTNYLIFGDIQQPVITKTSFPQRHEYTAFESRSSSCNQVDAIDDALKYDAIPSITAAIQHTVPTIPTLKCSECPTARQDGYTIFGDSTSFGTSRGLHCFWNEQSVDFLFIFMIYTVNAASLSMKDFNGLIIWILISVSALPMSCIGNNQTISITNNPNAAAHSCVVWYGSPICWGDGMYLGI